MPQTIALIDTLKRTLKAQGKTYADVAAALELSEASVKRLFSERSFSLQRLDRVCEFLGIEISDLVRSMENSSGEITELTEEQEKDLAGDINLLLTAQLLLNKWTFKEIISTYQIEELEGVRLLAKLDRMKLIELLPGNRVKLKISRHFSWRPHGPIQQFFEQQVQNEFLQSRFNKNGESRLFLSGMLSRRSNAEIQRRMQRLAAEFHALVAEDEAIPLNDKFGTAFVMAIRPWEPQSFTRLRREPSTKKF